MSEARLDNGIEGDYYDCMLTRNTKGSLVGAVGAIGGISRVAAQTYDVPSASRAGVIYRCFVERRGFPARVRCSCPAFTYWGKCKHGAVVLAAERFVAAADARQYKREVVHRRAFLAAATVRAYEPPGTKR